MNAVKYLFVMLLTSPLSADPARISFSGEYSATVSLAWQVKLNYMQSTKCGLLKKADHVDNAPVPTETFTQNYSFADVSNGYKTIVNSPAEPNTDGTSINGLRFFAQSIKPDRPAWF